MNWPFNDTAEERFAAKIRKTEGCWFWTARVTPDGYGQFRAGGSGSPNLRAHRVAWMLATGDVLPSDILVCHDCDEPLCVRPDHLFLGAPADNSADMVAKGRQCRGERHRNYGRAWSQVRPEQRARGERNGHARLTADIVREIRRLYATGEYRQVDLAAQFGTDQANVSAIVLRKAWAHV